MTPTRYNVDLRRSSPYFNGIAMMGMFVPLIAEQWRWEEAQWLGSSTRPIFGLLHDIGPEPCPYRRDVASGSTK